jgi:RNA polymerase sigma-70 factor (ECF subfamily)
VQQVQSDDDNTLVVKILQGDVESYRRIVERHQGRVFYLGLRFFRSEHDAEDFAQEVFLRAYEKLALFRGRVPFSAWLYRIAFNLAVNQYHVRKRKLAEVRAEAEPADSSPGPEAGLVRGEMIERVRAALRKIPEMYKVVVKMHFFDGLSYPEISRIMKIPVNTIKSHIFRAKEMLRRRLAHEAGDYLEEGVV